MPDRREADPEVLALTAAAEAFVRRLPALLKLLVVASGFLLAAMGAQMIWPGTRVTRLEAASLITNVRVDSLATVLRAHLTDEGITRRATQIYLCLNSEPAEQDMLQLPCATLIQNASRRMIRRPR
jgi:hypothetical protein